MRKRHLSVYYIILLMFLQVFVGSGVVFAGVEDFYFEDFRADYYLSKGEDGISKLRVIENLTAAFPDFRQNKGICRDIPFTNQGGANTTLPRLNEGDIFVLRNGEREPIYSIEKEGKFYEVCTGDENYVLGRQIYTFEYEFERVITDFSGYQELYWDTNGNGWAQRFESLTARIHIDETILDDVTGEAWCYVGKYGESGRDRCEITRTEDGFIFETGALGQNENLTFDIEFKSGAFVVPKPEKNYILVFVLVVIFGICLGIIIYIFRKYLKNKEKEDYFKSLFVKPEYQPSQSYSLEELAELYMGKKKDMKVAVLLDLVVRKRIELISEKKGWAFKVLNLEEVGGEEKILLAILNGGRYVKVGDVVSVVARQATMTLVDLNRSFYSTIRKGLISGGLVTDNYIMGVSGRASILMALIVNLVFVWPVLVFVIAGTTILFVEENMNGLIVFQDGFTLSVWVILFVTILVWTIFDNKVKRFQNITKHGIEAEKYMEGLELYIRMAEKDRLAFLQSVKGADVSAKGVVKLYEKLLPYAAVFGLEKSWMEEMEKYCKVEEIAEPDYLVSGIAISEISRMMNRTVTMIDSSTRMTSSGGSLSSGFSGGGGGGFSGGGGGGGGGGGR